MKKLLCLFSLFFVVFIIPVRAQDKQDAVNDLPVKQSRSNYQADKKEILKIVEQWREGYNSGNASAVGELYKEDAYYLTQHFITGIVRGRAAIQAYVQLGVDAKYHIDSIRALYVDCSDDFGYAITRYDATNNGQKAFGVNIVVLKKTGGKWLIVAHEAAVPDPGTAIQSLDTLRSQ